MNRRYQQVDPFNAGDPIMPWDELGDEFAPLDSGRGWTAPHDTSGSASTQAPSGTDSYPTASYPTTDKPPRQQQSDGKAKGRAQKPRASKPRTSKAKAPKAQTRQAAAPAKQGRTAKSGIGYIVTAIAILMLLGGLLNAIGSCVSSVFSSTNDYVTSSKSDSFGGNGVTGVNWNNVNEKLQGQQEQDFTTRLEAIKAGDDAAVKRGAQLLDKQFGLYASGRTLADVGVNSEDLARWMLASMTYDESGISSALYVSDSSLTDDGYVAVDVTLPYYNSLIYAIYNYANDTYRDQLKAGALSDAAKADVRAKLSGIMANTQQQDMYVSVDTHASVDGGGSNARVTLDENDWNTQIDELFGA